MNEKKRWLRGNSRIKNFDGGGYIINFSFNIKDMLSGKDDRGHPIEEFADADGWVNFSQSPKKETDQFGNVQSFWLNEFKPDPQFAKPKPEASSPESDDDVPF
jgi:hypothetical protein